MLSPRFMNPPIGVEPLVYTWQTRAVEDVSTLDICHYYRRETALLYLYSEPAGLASQSQRTWTERNIGPGGKSTQTARACTPSW